MHPQPKNAWYTTFPISKLAQSILLTVKNQTVRRYVFVMAGSSISCTYPSRLPKPPNCDTVYTSVASSRQQNAHVHAKLQISCIVHFLCDGRFACSNTSRKRFCGMQKGTVVTLVHPPVLKASEGTTAPLQSSLLRRKSLRNYFYKSFAIWWQHSSAGFISLFQPSCKNIWFWHIPLRQKCFSYSLAAEQSTFLHSDSVKNIALHHSQNCCWQFQFWICYGHAFQHDLAPSWCSFIHEHWNWTISIHFTLRTYKARGCSSFKMSFHNSHPTARISN